MFRLFGILRKKTKDISTLTDYEVYADSAGFYVVDYFGEGMPHWPLDQIKEHANYIGTKYEVGTRRGFVWYWELADGDMVFDEDTPESLRTFTLVHDESLRAFRENRTCRIPRKVRMA